MSHSKLWGLTDREAWGLTTDKVLCDRKVQGLESGNKSDKVQKTLRNQTYVADIRVGTAQLTRQTLRCEAWLTGMQRSKSSEGLPTNISNDTYDTKWQVQHRCDRDMDRTKDWGQSSSVVKTGFSSCHKHVPGYMSHKIYCNTSTSGSSTHWAQITPSSNKALLYSMSGEPWEQIIINFGTWIVQILWRY